jgi:hypothetical protein
MPALLLAAAALFVWWDRRAPRSKAVALARRAAAARVAPAFVMLTDPKVKH